MERDQLQRAAARRGRGAALKSAASAGEAAPLVRRESLADRVGPGIAATDYIRTFAEQIHPFVGRHYVALGTDGYGRSDFRRKLREFFEVDRHFVTVAALRALAEEGKVPPATVAKALEKYHIDPNKPNPITV